MGLRIHLITTDFPVVERKYYYAACGALVANTAVAYTWDEQPMGQAPEIKFGCTRCQKELKAMPTRRYLYGIYDVRQLKKPRDAEGAE